jgi:hypothetical protein
LPPPQDAGKQMELAAAARQTDQLKCHTRRAVKLVERKQWFQ